MSSVEDMSTSDLSMISIEGFAGVEDGITVKAKIFFFYNMGGRLFFVPLLLQPAVQSVLRCGTQRATN